MADTEFVIEPGRQDIVMTRVFDAPREVVFEAFTDPALIPNWWAPRDLTTEVDRMEVRPGGRWRFVNRDADGNAHGFNGVYHDVVAPELIVQTFEFEGAPGHVALVTDTFEEVDGQTRYVSQTVFQSVEDRDITVQMGAERGARESMDRLAEVIKGHVTGR
jgi:uncharacterized protein YndB with AHSA1/START domain